MAVKAPNPNHWTARELPDRLNFKIRTVKREKEGHHIMIKELIHREYLEHLNIHKGLP